MPTPVSPMMMYLNRYAYDMSHPRRQRPPAGQGGSNLQQANRGLGGVPSGPAHREIVLEREKRRRERLEGEDTPGGSGTGAFPTPASGTPWAAVVSPRAFPRGRDTPPPYAGALGTPAPRLGALTRQGPVLSTSVRLGADEPS